jgi:hypothetical protein
MHTKPEARPGLSESHQPSFRQGRRNLVHAVCYEADDIKEADDQYRERWVEQDFHFVRLLCVGAWRNALSVL